jgi:hypothetical protein
MIEALVLICGVYNGVIQLDRCLEINDLIGPYQTLEECISRTFEMENSLRSSGVLIMQITRELGTPGSAVTSRICREVTPPGVPT